MVWIWNQLAKHILFIVREILKNNYAFCQYYLKSIFRQCSYKTSLNFWFQITHIFKNTYSFTKSLSENEMEI